MNIDLITRVVYLTSPYLQFLNPRFGKFIQTLLFFSHSSVGKQAHNIAKASYWTAFHVKVKITQF